MATFCLLKVKKIKILCGYFATNSSKQKVTIAKFGTEPKAISRAEILVGH
ncbi:MAG: hypothetical protein ACJAZX_000833 [Rickettsiales bacterium]|jgi:hypothetical protein